MNATHITVTHALLVEDGVPCTLLQMSHICRADSGQLVALVEEGVLTPSGDAPPNWLFAGSELRRARTALRLTRDFGLNVAGAALALDLLDEIEALRSRLRRRPHG